MDKGWDTETTGAAARRPTKQGYTPSNSLSTGILACSCDARRRANVSVVSLTVTEGNCSATRLYESSGFISYGIEPMAVLTEDGYRAKVHMSLSLRGTDFDKHISFTNNGS